MRIYEVLFHHPVRVVIEQACSVVLVGSAFGIASDSFNRTSNLKEGDSLTIDDLKIGQSFYLGVGSIGKERGLLSGEYPLTVQVLNAVPVHKAIPEFFGQELLVLPHRNRIGSRLSGQGWTAPDQGRSRPTIPGAIQCPSENELLVLGPDGPTVGGYSHLATLSRLSLARFWRLGIGEHVQLRSVTFDQAETEWRFAQEALERLRTRLTYS